MCFGPVASFSSSVVLAAIGVATYVKVRTPSQRLFAASPLIFAAHQFIEGLLWNDLHGGQASPATSILISIFLFVAFFVWPIYMPLSIWLLEKNPSRRTLMVPFVMLGAGVGLYLLVHLVLGSESASVINCSIYYSYSIPGSGKALAILYLVATLGAYFLSSYRTIRIIGGVNFVSCVIAATVYYETFVSVWCFFASLLSVMICSFFRNLSLEEGSIDSGGSSPI